MRRLSAEAWQTLIDDAEGVWQKWTRVREGMIQAGLVSEENAWEPDWAPWDHIEKMRELRDEAAARYAQFKRERGAP